MSRCTPRQAPRRSRVLTVATLSAGLTIGLGGCSGDDSSGTSSVVGGVGGKTVGPGPSVTPTPPPKPKRASCSMLSQSAAARLLGAKATGHADTRQWPAGASELDGCIYTAGGGASLQYVVWSTPSGGAAKVTAPPIPSNGAAQRFSPGIGQSSTGFTISAGGRATAEVSAYSKGRLVQVTATTPDTTGARRAATEAARALVSTR